MKQIAFAKFAQAHLTFEQYPSCYYGGFEGLVVKLNKMLGNADELSSVQLFYPSADDGHTARYRTVVDLFWIVALPGIHRDAFREISDNAMRPRQTCEKTIGNVTIKLSEISGQVELEAIATSR